MNLKNQANDQRPLHATRRAETTLVWFRHDLRLADQPALTAALERGGPVVCAFIWAPDEEGAWPAGAAARWWLHQSLTSLDALLHRIGARLILRRGPTLHCLRELASECGASAVFWNRRYEPASCDRDAGIKAALKNDGLQVQSFNGSLLVEPWMVKTKSGMPFQVFTPFWKACLGSIPDSAPLAPPSALVSPRTWPASLKLMELGLQPDIDWAAGMRESWQPGEPGAADRLERFLKDGLANYANGRNRPDQSACSRLSPHLHFGEISVRQIWTRLRQYPDNESKRTFLSELGWREFAHHLLFHFRETPAEPLRKQFTAFPWRNLPQALRAWQRGQTGYPMVDAGMRELWQTGWMHNRVRMIAASFLVKHLLIPWQSGAEWFWDTLVDADLANNTLGWQWTAGCGADAAPYFRIFNPVTQGEKFDPQGDYVRRWIPELADLPSAWIHQPWQAPADVLADAGVHLGTTYPEPIVDHREARAAALAAFASMQKK